MGRRESEGIEKAEGEGKRNSNSSARADEHGG
jgi:hypothetical protein